MKYNLSILAALFLTAFVNSAFADNSTAPVPSSSELRQEMRQDTQKIKAQNQVIQSDKTKLNQDIQQYGANSSQVQADRGQLKQDYIVRKGLKMDRRAKYKEMKQVNAQAPVQSPAQPQAQ
jgi:uncharacterized protein YlxW (UPF0749 family)